MTTFEIDTTKPFGQRVLRRLLDERIAWLITVGADLTPQPRPVWFLWDGTQASIYSKPNTAKLAHMARVARASLHFDGDGQGGDIVVLTGHLRAAPELPSADLVAAYVEKYRELIAQMGATPETFARAYSVGLAFTPDGVRGH